MAIPAITRLMARVIESDSGCLEWQGATRGPMGYSTLGNDRNVLPKLIYGHVLSYQHHKGEIPQGMIVRHSCDNPICVNPDHLELGTHADNRRDVLERNRDGDHTLKMTPDKVREMRQLKSEGESTWELAARYGISRAQAHKIIAGDMWGWVM